MDGCIDMIFIFLDDCVNRMNAWKIYSVEANINSLFNLKQESSIFW